MVVTVEAIKMINLRRPALPSERIAAMSDSAVYTAAPIPIRYIQLLAIKYVTVLARVAERGFVLSLYNQR